MDAFFLSDPELGSTSFTVERNTYTRSREGTASRAAEERASGCIHPGTAEARELLPEEERHETFIVVYTDYPLSTGVPEDAGASFAGADRIRWNGQAWRVVKVRNWQEFGYVQAWAVRIQEDKENRE